MSFLSKSELGCKTGVISGVQAVFLLFITRVFYTLIFIPSDSFSGKAAAAGMLISAFAELICVIPPWILAKKRGENAYESISRRFPKAGKAIGFAYSLFFILLSSWGITTYSEYIVSTTGEAPSLIVYVIPVAVICAYMAGLGIDTLGRVAGIVFVIFIVFLPLMWIICMPDSASFGYAEHTGNYWRNVFNYAVTDFSLSGWTCIYAVLTPNIRGKKPVAFAAIGIKAVFSCFIFIFCSILLGLAASVQRYPFYAVGGYLHFGKTGNLDPFSVFAFSLTALFSIAVSIYASAKCIGYCSGAFKSPAVLTAVLSAAVSVLMILAEINPGAETVAAVGIAATLIFTVALPLAALAVKPAGNRMSGKDNVKCH